MAVKELHDITQTSFVVVPAAWTVAQAQAFVAGQDKAYVIVMRTDAAQPYYYLYTLAQFDSELRLHPGDTPLLYALNLHEYTSTAVLDDPNLTGLSPARYVVVVDGRVVGYREAAHYLPPDATFPSGVPSYGLEGFEKDLEFPKPADFNAFPKVDAPAQVAPAAEFMIVVGFRSDRDPLLDKIAPIHIQNPPPNAKLTVVLFTEGLERLDGHRRQLPLDPDLNVTFRCKPRAGVSEAEITVEYVYEGQVVGMATRHVQVGAQQIMADARSKMTPPEGNPCRLTSLTDAHRVDLTVTIQRDGDKLFWSIVAPNPPLELDAETDVPDAPTFAGNLVGQLKNVNFQGPFAANILETNGDTIADAMPTIFFDALTQVHSAIQRRPTLLIYTEEFYVPWELAVLPTPLDDAAPPFLAAQTTVGRWLKSDKVVHPPPVEICIERATLIASEYGLDSGQRRLKEAIAEQAALNSFFSQRQLTPVLFEAKADDLLAVTQNRHKGHLVHFAVHGLSDPQANEQVLILADKQRLPANALVRRYRCGDEPCYDLVFLNACQVGTAGSSLGQAAGFPGTLIRGGVSAFVAPLWEVHDEAARQLAEGFYAATIEKKQTIAEYLLDQRCQYQGDQTTTPMAYIFYGHPNLRLTVHQSDT